MCARVYANATVLVAFASLLDMLALFPSNDQWC